jgi:hypothetical protein
MDTPQAVLQEWNSWCAEPPPTVSTTSPFRPPDRTEHKRCLHFTYDNGRGAGPGAGDYHRRWQGLLFYHRPREGIPTFRGWGYAMPPLQIMSETAAPLSASSSVLRVEQPYRFPNAVPFWLMLQDHHPDSGDTTNREVVSVTAIGPDGSYTISRAQLGTQAVDHPSFDHLSWIGLVLPTGDPSSPTVPIHYPPPTTPWVRIEVPADFEDKALAAIVVGAPPPLRNAQFEFYFADPGTYGYPGDLESRKEEPPSGASIFSHEGPQAEPPQPPSHFGQGELAFERPWWLFYRKTTAGMTRFGGSGAQWEVPDTFYTYEPWWDNF